MCHGNCPHRRFAIGLELLKKGDIEAAAELAAIGVCEHPDDGPLWELLGVAHQRADRPDLAREALEMATLLKPLDIGARFCLAEAYQATGSDELAVFVYRLVADNPQTPLWLLPKVASHLGEMREFGHALGVCQLIVEREAHRHEAHFGIAFYMRRMGGHPARIMAAVATAHTLAPTVLLYRVVYASLLSEAGRQTEAYELLRMMPLTHSGCSAVLRRMMEVFYTANDVQRIWDCSRCLRDMELDEDLK